jgi:hypothetical protein
MSSKYRGKFTNSRECKHAEEVMMELVVVKESCPVKFKSSSGTLFSDKHRCQECEHFEKEENHE